MKKLLLIIASLTLSSGNAWCRESKRQQCRQEEQRCERGESFQQFMAFSISKQNPVYCRLVFKACMRQELNMTCTEIYSKRNQEQNTTRTYIDDIGHSILGVGVGGGGVTALTFLWLGNPVGAIAGASIVGAGLVIGLPVTLLSRIPYRYEKIHALSDKKDHHFWTNYHLEKYRNKIVARINGKTQEIDIEHKQLEKLVKAGISSGRFCENYPYAIKPRQLVNYLAEKIDQGAIDVIELEGVSALSDGAVVDAARSPENKMASPATVVEDEASAL